MYTEFIIGYALSAVTIIMLAVVIVLLCKVLKNGGAQARPQNTPYASYGKSNAYSGNRGTVICRNCATQFDAVHAVCPRCGTPR